MSVLGDEKETKGFAPIRMQMYYRRGPKYGPADIGESYRNDSGLHVGSARSKSRLTDMRDYLVVVAAASKLETPRHGYIN